MAHLVFSIGRLFVSSSTGRRRVSCDGQTVGSTCASLCDQMVRVLQLPSVMGRHYAISGETPPGVSVEEISTRVSTGRCGW